MCRKVAAALILISSFAAPATAQTRATARTDSDAAAGATVAGMSLACFGVTVAAGLAAYLAPLGIALLRGHPNTAPVAVVNLFLGWTLVGWVVALAWALSATERRRYGAG